MDVKGQTGQLTSVVREIMAERRAVGEAKRGAGETPERRARDRVHAARVALGKRGKQWWGRGGQQA